jgi:hypothetical protein
MVGHNGQVANGEISSQAETSYLSCPFVFKNLPTGDGHKLAFVRREKRYRARNHRCSPGAQYIALDPRDISYPATWARGVMRQSTFLLAPKTRARYRQTIRGVLLAVVRRCVTRPLLRVLSGT